MLGTLTAPTLLGSCAGNEAGKATGLSFALNHFGVSENDMQKVLAAALEKGGDYADLFLRPTSTSAWASASWPATRQATPTWRT